MSAEEIESAHTYSHSRRRRSAAAAAGGALVVALLMVAATKDGVPARAAMAVAAVSDALNGQFLQSSGGSADFLAKLNDVWFVEKYAGQEELADAATHLANAMLVGMFLQTTPAPAPLLPSDALAHSFTFAVAPPSRCSAARLHAACLRGGGQARADTWARADGWLPAGHARQHRSVSESVRGFLRVFLRQV